MQKLSGATKGAIVGVALFAGVMTSSVWSSPPQPAGTVDASSCGKVFAGRAGQIDTCKRPKDDQVARNIKQGVGTTFTGCLLGGLSGGLPGLGYGCLGGLASNIPWNGWAK